MQNDYSFWARWVRLQVMMNPGFNMSSTAYPERWTDCALIRLFSSDKVTTCSEVNLDKLGRDCQATVELDTRILKCVEALKDQGWFSDETQGVTLKENPVANASVAGTCRDLRHIEAAHVVWLHSCIVQCSHAAIAAVLSETQGEISPAKSGAASIATKEAGECVCQRAGYPYEKLLCMHQISFHIVRALKFLMSAADHQHLCLRQFHSALIAQTQNGTAQKYDTAIFPVAAAKKQLLLRLEYIVNNYAVHTAFVARVFKSVHAWGHTLAQTEIKGREVETHSVGETTCSEVDLDKLGRDCQATVELDTRILKCVEALKDQGWFSDETQGVTLKENPVANASVAGTCRDLRHIEAAHVVWLHSCIVQCSHAAIAAVLSETQGEISPAKSGAASIATKEAGECVCQRAGYPYEKLLCMHQISFHIVRALKFLMSAADHQHLCLRQFHSALIAQTQNGTAQKYDTAIFPVAAAKKQLLLRLEYIVNNYAVHTAFVARVFKSVHAWGHTLAQTEIKGREVETHSDAASTMPTAGSHLPTLGAAPAYQITTSDLTSYPKPMDTSDTGVYGAYVLDTYMENWHICMVFLIHSV